jgi:regulatory protein
MNPENAKLFQKALNFAYFYLKFRSRTEREIVLYLQKKAEKYGFTPEVIQSVVEDLKHNDLINDAEFVKMYVESKTKSKPTGANVLKMELMRLGVQKDFLIEHFEDSPVDESQQAMQALEKRWHRFSTLDQKKRFEKAASFLMRRGFSFDTVKKTIAQLEEKE